MWFSLCLAMAAIGAPPERLLLIEDTATVNFERTLVHQQLLRNLMRDPTNELIHAAALPTQLHRSVALQEQADLLVGDARRHLHALNPAEAAISASAAVMRYSRVAELTGDVTGLAEALSLDAAAHLLLGHTEEARRALHRLLVLDGSFVPSPTLFNHSMQRQVRAVAGAMYGAPHQTVALVVPGASSHAAPGAPLPANTSVAIAEEVAVFVDGHFVGFGGQRLELLCGVRHYVWLVPKEGEPQGGTVNPLDPKKGVACFDPTLSLPLWPQRGGSLGQDNSAQFGHVVAASRLETGEVDPYHPGLASRQVDTVLVLAYVKGALRLTTFELRQGQRRVRQTAAVVTNFWDVARIANCLLDLAPPLAAVPNPSP